LIGVRIRNIFRPTVCFLANRNQILEVIARLYPDLRDSYVSETGRKRRKLINLAVPLTIVSVLKIRVYDPECVIVSRTHIMTV
jgi:hypothetical protein